MAAKLPYLASPGTIVNALDKISKAATPDRVSKDFVNTKLKIKGGSGSAVVPFLKKIGFVANDGTPTKFYEQYRNPATSGAAVAAGIKYGYKALYEVNEFAHDLSDADLKGLVVQVTGLKESDSVVKQTFSTFKKLKQKANFDSSISDASSGDDGGEGEGRNGNEGSGGGGSGKRFPMNIGYTINLNLPATTNIEVFNAIFKSLKEHLVDDE